MELENTEYCKQCGSDQMPINEEKCRDCGEEYYKNAKTTEMETAIKQAWFILDKCENENADEWQNKYAHLVF